MKTEAPPDPAEQVFQGRHAGAPHAGTEPVSFKAEDLADRDGNAIESTPHPMMEIRLKLLSERRNIRF
jgi:hypothetical protein